eukprot:772139-Lingulodinium_polyedra.AAC.1
MVPSPSPTSSTWTVRPLSLCSGPARTSTIRVPRIPRSWRLVANLAFPGRRCTTSSLSARELRT